MNASKIALDSTADDLIDPAELQPERVRAALRLNKWGGRLSAAMGALLPASILLVYSYYRSLSGEAPPNAASPIGIILTMAYFAVLQYMIFVVGGSVVKMRFEMNRQMEDLRRELLKRVPLPTDQEASPPEKKKPASSRSGARQEPTQVLAKRIKSEHKAAGDPLDTAVMDLRGVRAHCKKLAPWFAGPQRSQAYRVINMGSNGLALRCNDGLRQGDRLQIRLTAPGCEPLDLRCQVRWHGGDGEHDPGAVGVAFMPFNGEPDCNPPEAQARVAEFREMAAMAEVAE